MEDSGMQKMQTGHGILRGKYLQTAAVIVLGALIIGLYVSTLGGQQQDQPEQIQPSQQIQQDQDDGSSASETEARLAQVLSQMQGVGRVEVMITYESGPEIVPAQITQTDTSEQSDSDAQASSSSTTSRQSTQPALGTNSETGAVVLKELAPVVKGVVVIAQGAEDIGVKLNLLRATVTALQIDAQQVDVFAMQQD
jgi:stage III sporulation protein AG